jgi:hypothetical protein
MLRERNWNKFLICKEEMLQLEELREDNTKMYLQKVKYEDTG